MIKCTKCGAENEDGTHFCEKCGQPLTMQHSMDDKKCPQCGNLVSRETQYCDRCGYNFKKQTVKSNRSQNKDDSIQLAPKPRKKHAWLAVLIGTVALVLLGFNGYLIHRQYVHQRHEQQVAVTRKHSASSRQRAKEVSLKAANAALRKKQKQATATSQSEVTQEKAAATSSTSSQAATSSAETQSELANAETMRNQLVSYFGCNEGAVDQISDTSINQISHESEAAGEDIAGFYQRIVAQYPNVGGNVLGPDADQVSGN